MPADVSCCGAALCSGRRPRTLVPALALLLCFRITLPWSTALMKGVPRVLGIPACELMFGNVLVCS